MAFTDALHKVIARQGLSREESRAAFTDLMDGSVTPVKISSFLTALRVKGETVDEITGAAEAMRAAAIPVQTKLSPIVDTCGTGGDGQGSFNVSTAAAFVVAGAGVAVAKHGNRSVSSRSGSADVLEALGLRVDTDAATAERCLSEIGLAFLFAPAFHPAMKHAMPVRRELGVRTIFNLLGPLTNPAKPHVQLLGVYDAAWLKPVAEVMAQLGTREGIVVHGRAHDEIVLSGPTKVAEIEDGHVHTDEWWPEDFGIKTEPDADLAGGTAAENGEILVKLLNGDRSVYRTAVCMNAAAVLRASARFRSNGSSTMSLRDAYRVAEESIDAGRAREKLQALRKVLGAQAA